MDLEQRVERLERRNRRLTGALTIAAAMLVSVFIMGQVRPDQRVTAGSFAVTNKFGQTVAVLGTDGDQGLPYLNLYSPDQDMTNIYLGIGRVTSETRSDPSTRRTAYQPSLTMSQPPPLSTDTTRTMMSLNLGLDAFSRTPQIYMADDKGTVFWQAP